MTFLMNLSLIVFFNSVKDLFTPAAKGKEYKIQAYFELKNYQWTEFVDCIFLSCHVPISEWIHTLYLPECQGTPCSKQAWYLKFKWLQRGSNPQPLKICIHWKYNFIRNAMKEDILKRIIVNGSRDSSWLFKRFNKLQVIVADNSNMKNIFSS